MTFSVDLKIGSHTWSMTQHKGKVADGLYVLSGLQFGWTTPSNGPWPAQPDAMSAALALNVPFFGDVADIVEGDPVAIEVKADSTGDVIARFYGDVTNRKATPRPGRRGVTFSLVAVDPTVRINEFPRVDGPVMANPGVEEDSAEVLLDFIWENYLPGLVDLTGIDYTPSPVHIFQPSGNGVREAIDALLLNLVDQGAYSRMILSPYIAGGVLAPAASGRYYTLDTVLAGHPPGSESTPFVFPADSIAREQLVWNSAKGQNAGAVQITGLDSAGDPYVRTHTISDDGAGTAVEVIPSLLVGTFGFIDADAMAAFYGQGGWATYQVEDLTLLATDADLDVPVGLFPDWTLDENDPGRASCYTQRITVTDLDITVTPNITDTLDGVLTGAQCRITGGKLYLDLSMRTLTFDVDPSPFRTASIGGASIGGLTPA